MIQQGRSSPLAGDEARQVLHLVAAGRGTEAIARHLGCDRDDVRRHLADALRALAACSVREAVRIAIRRGLIAPSGPPA